jgi:hypothetical protein
MADFRNQARAMGDEGIPGQRGATGDEGVPSGVMGGEGIPE